MSLPLRSASQSAVRTGRYICPRCSIREQYGLISSSRYSNIRYSSTETPAPPLLAKLKGDLKTAMKAKDAPRLNVLRAMISEYNNASKTNQPIKTDAQLLALLKRKKSSSEAAIQEARQAKRDDLAEKQEKEIEIMNEYAGSVAVMSDDAISESVTKVIEKLRSEAKGAELKAGSVLKDVFKSLEGQAVDRAQVAKTVNELLTGKSGLQKDQNPSNSVSA